MSGESTGGKYHFDSCVSQVVKRNWGPPTVFTTLSSSPMLRAVAVLSLSSSAFSMSMRELRTRVGEEGRGRCVSTASMGMWIYSTWPKKRGKNKPDQAGKK